MDLRVDPADVRHASKRYMEIADSLGKPRTYSRAAPDQVGHIEVADWLSKLSDDLANAHQALAAGTEKLAGSLSDAASALQEADQTAGQQAHDIERGIGNSGDGHRMPLPAVWGNGQPSESDDLLGHFDPDAPTQSPEPMPGIWNNRNPSSPDIHPTNTDGGRQ